MTVIDEIRYTQLPTPNWHSAVCHKNVIFCQHISCCLILIIVFQLQPLSRHTILSRARHAAGGEPVAGRSGLSRTPDSCHVLKIRPCDQRIRICFDLEFGTQAASKTFLLVRRRRTHRLPGRLRRGSECTERSLSIREKLLGTRESCTELLSGLYCANNDSLCACIMFVSHTHGPHVWWHSFLKLSSSYYFINRIPSKLFLILEELNNRVTKNEFYNRAIACVEHEKLAVKNSTDY